MEQHLQWYREFGIMVGELEHKYEEHKRRLEAMALGMTLEAYEAILMRKANILHLTTVGEWKEDW